MESVTTAAAKAYEHADLSDINADVVIWETLSLRYERARKKSPAAFVIEPGNFIVRMINSAGLQEYQKWREAVASKRKPVDQQG